MSVHAETMSREVPSCTPFCVSLLFCATIVLSIKCVGSLPDRCLEVVRLDVEEIEDHLSKINLTDVPTVKMMAAGFKCPISALPFGALKSDWSRLLLLQEAQPDGSIIKRKLARVMRFLIIAYYQMEESFDVIKSDTQILQQSLGRETTTMALAANESRSLSANQSWTTESSDTYYRHSHPYLSPITLHKVLCNNDCTTGNFNSTAKVGITTAKIPSNLRELNASLVPIDPKVANISTMIDISAVTARYRPMADAVEAAAGNAASTTLDNCLRQSLKDILSRKPPNRTRYPVFERLQGKWAHGERSSQQRRNEINGWTKNADVPAKIPPPVNDFWRNAQFPTGAPLTISTIARPYQVQGLNGFRMNPRKSRKRAGLNSDGHTKAMKVLRCLTKIKKNKEMRRYTAIKSDIAIEPAGKK